jgi:protein-disulfide isomerase
MFASRRQVLVSAAAFGLAGCSASSGSGGAEGDMTIGSREARVTLLEYFSATCGACAAFHASVYPQIKANYVDTGRLRWVFRELLTPPQAVSLAAFQMARCGGATSEQYMARIGVVFAQQMQILQSSPQAIRDQLIRIGQSSGLSAEQVEQCIADPTGRDRALAAEAQARRDQVTGTPTLFLNGERVEPSGYSVEGLSRLIDARLGAGG